MLTQFIALFAGLLLLYQGIMAIKKEKVSYIIGPTYTGKWATINGFISIVFAILFFLIAYNPNLFSWL